MSQKRVVTEKRWWGVRYLGVILRHDDKMPYLYRTRREAAAALEEFHRPDVAPFRVTLTYKAPK